MLKTFWGLLVVFLGFCLGNSQVSCEDQVAENQMMLLPEEYRDTPLVNGSVGATGSVVCGVSKSKRRAARTKRSKVAMGQTENLWGPWVLFIFPFTVFLSSFFEPQPSLSP